MTITQAPSTVVDQLAEEKILRDWAETLWSGWLSNRENGKYNPFQPSLAERTRSLYRGLGGTIDTHDSGPIEAVRRILVERLDRYAEIIGQIEQRAAEAEHRACWTQKDTNECMANINRMRADIR